MELNDRMEFGHVIHVHMDGKITDPTGIHAPETYIYSDDDGQISREHQKDMIENARRQGWTLLTGWTGQYLSGDSAIMHNSEYIGGGLETHIRENPGYYVTCVVTTDDEDDAGWVVAFREDPGTASGYRPCACRDCFEIAIGIPGAMCNECDAAGCEHGEDCSRDDLNQLECGCNATVGCDGGCGTEIE